MYITIALFLSNYILAQQFSTKICITSVNNEKDVLEIGYDPKGTFGVDEEFGEVDCKNPKLDGKFQAYIINPEMFNRFHKLKNPFFLKKQIMGMEYEDIEDCFIGVMVPVKYLPITISWDKALFQDPKRSKSFITDASPANWPCIGNTFTWRLKQRKEINAPQPVIDSEVYLEKYNDGTKEHSMYVFYFIFDGNELKSDTKNIISDDNINIYPNPTTDFIHINNKANVKIQSIHIYSVDGRVIKQINKPTEKIDCRDWKEGIYILKMKTDKGTASYKINKRNN